MQIKADFTELNKFIHFTRSQAIGIIKRSIRATVNDQAYSTQKVAKFKEIPGSMTTRGKFNQMLVRVTPAKGMSLVSEVGAINFKNYFGLRNLEKGKTEKNPAIPHIKEVRGGNKKKKIVRSKQLGKLGTFKKIRGGKELSMLSNSGYTGYFIMKGNNTSLTSGIYKFMSKGKTDKQSGFRRRKIIKVRNTTEKRTTAKKNKWLYRSTLRGASASLSSRFWVRNQDKQLKRTMDRLFK